MPSFCFRTFLYSLLSLFTFLLVRIPMLVPISPTVSEAAPLLLFFPNVFPFLLRQMELFSVHFEGIFSLCSRGRTVSAPPCHIPMSPSPLPTVWSARDVGTGGSTLLQMGFFENYYQSMNVQHHKCSTYIDSDDSGRHTDYYRTQHAEIE